MALIMRGCIQDRVSCNRLLRLKRESPLCTTTLIGYSPSRHVCCEVSLTRCLSKKPNLKKIKSGLLPVALMIVLPRAVTRRAVMSPPKIFHPPVENHLLAALPAEVYEECSARFCSIHSHAAR